MHMSSLTGPQPNSLRSLTTMFHVMRHNQSNVDVQNIISTHLSISTIEHGLSDLGKQAVADESDRIAEQMEDGVKIAVFLLISSLRVRWRKFCVDVYRRRVWRCTKAGLSSKLIIKFFINAFIIIQVYLI